MLMKDKTASNIKRKVQLAKQQVDRDFSEANKTFTNADKEVADTYEKVQELEADLASAQVRAGAAIGDATEAANALDTALDKQGKVWDLIAQFEEDLEALL